MACKKKEGDDHHDNDKDHHDNGKHKGHGKDSDSDKKKDHHPHGQEKKKHDN